MPTKLTDFFLPSSTQRNADKTPATRPISHKIKQTVTTKQARAIAPIVTKKRVPSAVIDITDSSFDVDSSIEIVSGPPPKPLRQLPATTSKAQAIPMTCVEISSDTQSNKPGKGAIMISQESPDNVPKLRTKRVPETAMQERQMKRRRVSDESGSSPEHVELLLAEPKHWTSSKDVCNVLAREPGPSLTCHSLSEPRREALPRKKSNIRMDDVSISGLATQDTNKTNALPITSTAPAESAEDIVARMKAAVSERCSSPLTSDDEEDGISPKRIALTFIDSSDGDEDLELPSTIGPLTPRSPTLVSNWAPSTVRVASSTSSPSQPAKDTSLIDAEALTDSGESSNASSPVLRRSRRVIPSHRTLSSIVVGLRKKKSPFDILLAEDARTKKRRIFQGQSNGFEATNRLAEMQYLDSSEDDEHSSNASEGGPAGRALSKRTKLSRATSQIPTAADSTKEIETRTVAKPEIEHVVAAQRFLGTGAQKLRGILRGNGIGTIDENLEDSRGHRRFWANISKAPGSDEGQFYRISRDSPAAEVRTAVIEKNTFKAALLVSKWSAKTVNNEVEFRGFATYLLREAMYSEDILLGELATDKICDVIRSHTKSYLSNFGLGFQTIIVTGLSTLGALGNTLHQLHIVKAGHLNIEMAFPSSQTTVQNKHQRDQSVARFLRVIRCLLDHASLDYTEFADLLVILMLIGADPSSSPELLRQVHSTIDGSIRNLDIRLEKELFICQSITRAFSGCTCPQKRLYASLLPDNCGRQRRMQSWVAYGLLLPQELASVSHTRYGNPPPLTVLITHLDPHEPLPALACSIASSMPQSLLFNIRKSGGETIANYDDITEQAVILDIMLSDVRAFVEYERETECLDTGLLELTASAPTRPQKRLSPLEHLMGGLMVLHDTILDARAAHLDRSRTKEIVQRVHVRLTYERWSALEIAKHKDGAHARLNLDAHFGRKPTSDTVALPSTPTKTRPRS